MNRFTLSEFVFYARHFLVIEEVLLANRSAVEPDFKSELARTIERLEALMTWFERRRLEQLTCVRTEFLAMESGLVDTLNLTTAVDGELMQQIVTREKRVAYIKQRLVTAEAIINNEITALTLYAEELRERTFARFPK
jgi:hypothetical protein